MQGQNRYASKRDPRAIAMCDRCDKVKPHHKLKKQMQYFGSVLRWTGFLVCASCYDKPDLQVLGRATALPPDPVPIKNPRPDDTAS